MPPLTYERLCDLNTAAQRLHLGPLAFTTAELDAIGPHTPRPFDLPLTVFGRRAVEIPRWPRWLEWADW